MNQINFLFNKWLKNVQKKELLDELTKISGNGTEIKDRFGKNIAFGTAGIRGIMGAGTNRINIHTIRKVSQGLANYLLKKCANPSICISYDSRINSYLFAKETASVMSANGIKVYITNELAPTPFLSYCVRKIGTSAGVMITASHNSSEYNGYKCYGNDGAQFGEEVAGEVYEFIKDLDPFDDVKLLPFEKCIENGMVEFINDNMANYYINDVLKQRLNLVDMSEIKVTYTPLNGTGYKYVKSAFEKSGVKQLEIVESQKNPDGEFTTCKYPNPEFISAFYESLKLAKKCYSDIIVATDPDADRLGVCVYDSRQGEYRLLSGNEIGILLTNYILQSRRERNNLPKNGIIVKTIVSSDMVDDIAKDYGVTVKKVLTGFKNIASEILKLEKNNQEKRYIFGFEESNGYLSGTYVRDKDGVMAALLITEATAYYKKNYSENLIEVLENLEQRYGYYAEKTISFEFKGYEGSKKISTIMDTFRNVSLKTIGKYKIEKLKDYINLNDGMKSNVIELRTTCGKKIIVRPSGTEPKLKIYLTSKSKTKEDKLSSISELEKCMKEYIENIKTM